MIFPEGGISLIKQNYKAHLKKYSNVYVLYKYRKVVENISKNNSIVIAKQNKGRGAIIVIDKIKYAECLKMLNTK